LITLCGAAASEFYKTVNPPILLSTGGRTSAQDVILQGFQLAAKGFGDGLGESIKVEEKHSFLNLFLNILN
jgi:hypothetical protein